MLWTFLVAVALAILSFSHYHSQTPSRAIAAEKNSTLVEKKLDLLPLADRIQKYEQGIRVPASTSASQPAFLPNLAPSLSD